MQCGSIVDAFFCEKGQHHINMKQRSSTVLTLFTEGSLQKSEITNKSLFFFLPSSRLFLCSIRTVALQHAAPPSLPCNQTKKATPEGKPHEILGRRTSAVELSRLTTQLRHLLCETERSCTRSSKKTNQRRRKPKRLAPPPARSGSPAAKPHRPAEKTPKQADRNGIPPPARNTTRKTSPQGANKSSTPHTEGRRTTNLNQRPSLEPAPTSPPPPPTSPPPPLEKGRGTKTARSLSGKGAQDLT